MISEHLKFIAHRYKAKKLYPGSLADICSAIIEDCWNGTYYTASTGHFDEFYVRDFGFCAESLLALGHRDRVLATLAYCLHIFHQHNRISVMITTKKLLQDFPAYPSDSLPLLLRALRLAKAKGLQSQYKVFLEQQTQMYYNTIFDPNLGIVRPTTHFSDMKDHALRNSSCYANCMVSLLSDELNYLGWKNPWKDYDLKASIREHFWNGQYFREEINTERITGDGQVMPFWCGVVNDTSMFRSCYRALHGEGLDIPFPLKYTSSRNFHHIWIPWIFVPNYEGNSIWMFIGMVYLEVVRQFDHKLLCQYLHTIGKRVKKYQRFVELYNPDGSPYSTPFYMADTMIWAAIYLRLYTELP